jgi:dual specificity phosphatase 12
MFLDCNEIIENKVWVGSFIRPEEVRFLRQLGITTVVSLQSDRDLEDYHVSKSKLQKTYEAAEIELRRVPTEDFNKAAISANLGRSVEELEKALAPRWAKVYVHCTAGINRGPTLVAAYLIKSRKMSAQEACDYVTAKRHCSPYHDVLEAYEASFTAGPGSEIS